jgi:alkanesulfonate monooxygenase SsuD/methylene tetrahydromethanopterin reductase-like flavin-dependent oxidoreductase (luciferase family)
LQFGLFDHIDLAGDRPLAQQYDERLQFVAAADAAGFYAYHLAEHHATPLNTVPVPGAFLAAVARATKRIRMGPMVYLLPLYTPLRLIEEIAILDHLSHGRMEIGVGRGVSPYELGFHKVDAAKSREIFIDAFDCMVEGLTHDRLTYHGPFYNYDDVPVILRPLQQPYPAMWYGSSNTVGAAWAGERGLHFASNGTTERAKENIDAYVAALAKRGTGVEHPHAEFPGGGAIGVSRQIVVAETDAEAMRIAKPAHEHIHANQMFLRREALRRTDMKSREGYIDAPSAGNFELSLSEGSAIAGSPETVRAEIERQIERLGINYLICYMMFGTMSLADALRSMELFNTEVRPAFKTSLAGAAASR